MTYFADTSFWIALSRKRDQFHRAAAAWYQFLIASRSPIVTTEAVLWEWMNAQSAPETRRMVAEAYRRVHADPRIEVVPFDRDLIHTAIEFYGARPDKHWSLTDCLSFVVMERRGLEEALTADRDFEQANLKPVLSGNPPLPR